MVDGAYENLKMAKQKFRLESAGGWVWEPGRMSDASSTGEGRTGITDLGNTVDRTVGGQENEVGF